MDPRSCCGLRGKFSILWFNKPSNTVYLSSNSRITQPRDAELQRHSRTDSKKMCHYSRRHLTWVGASRLCLAMDTRADYITEAKWVCQLSYQHIYVHLSVELSSFLKPSCVLPERRSARFSFSSRKKHLRSVVFRLMTNSIFGTIGKAHLTLWVVLWTVAHRHVRYWDRVYF